MTQTLKALRIQTLKIGVTFAIPWYSIAVAIALCATAFAAINNQVPDSSRTVGAVLAFYFSGIGMQPWLVTQMFPFTMALSVTRRAFVQATMLLIAGEAVIAGVGLTILNRIEIATHGWFVHMRLLDLSHIHQDNVLAQALVYAVPMAAVSTLMAFVGTVFRTFGLFGLWAFFAVLAVAATAVLVILALTHSFGNVADFFGSQPMLANLGVYPLVLVALFGTGWAALMMRARV